MATTTTTFTNQIGQLVEEDLIVEILVRLPTSSLLRFKRVSKKWLQCISSPNFSVQRRRHSIQKKDDSFFVLRYLNIFAYPEKTTNIITPVYVSALSKDVFLSQQQQQQHDSIIDFPHLETDCDRVLHYMFPLGQYGVYGVFEFISGIFMLWNPCSGETKALPRSPYHNSAVAHPHTYHFGTTLELLQDGTFTYKVGRVSSSCSRWCCVDYSRESLSLSLELYSSSTKSWKLISNFAKGQFLVNADWFSHCANLNGKAHWMITSSLEEEEGDMYVTAFDYQTESFSQIKAPSHPPQVVIIGGAADHYNKRRCVVTLFDDKFLCLVLFRNINNDDDDHFKKMYIDIWVMREYGIEDSWTKVFTVGPISKWMEVLRFSSKLQCLFLKQKIRRSPFLYLCDCNSSKIKSYPLPGERVSQEMQVVEYVESLVSPFSTS